MNRVLYVFFVFNFCANCFSQITRFTNDDSELYGFINESGDTIFEAQFWEASTFKDYWNHGPNYNYAAVQVDNGKAGILNDSGVYVIPLKYDATGLYQFQDSTSKWRQFAFLVNYGSFKSKVWLYDLDRNEMSNKPFEFFSLYCSHFIFKKRNKYGVMDAEMNIIYQGTDRLVSRNGHDFGSCSPLHLSPSDSVLYQLKITRKNQREKKRWGLVNTFTEKSIPIHYDYIHIKMFNERKYYWAFKFDSPKSNHGSLDVYDAEMNLVKNIQFEKIICTDLNAPYYRCPFRRDQNPFLFINSEHKTGGIAPNGEISIPFEFDYVDLESTVDYELKYITLKREGNLFYFNEEGEQIEVKSKE